MFGGRTSRKLEFSPIEDAAPFLRMPLRLEKVPCGAENQTPDNDIFGSMYWVWSGVLGKYCKLEFNQYLPLVEAKNVS